jgi:hypothetical protein
MDLAPPGLFSGQPARPSAACEDWRAVPNFCRHNRLLQNCPICSREQAVELRPLISPPPSRRSGAEGQRRPAPGESPPRARERGPGARRPAVGLRVRRLARGADDGYRCPLVPGLRSSEEAERVAGELALSAGRLRRLAEDPPGLYAEVGDPRLDLEERTWLAFLIAYLGALEADDPFAAIRASRTSWASGVLPDLAGVAAGPRGAHDSARGARTLQAYRGWVERSGSQQAAFTGEPAWSPERRFARDYERLALPGLTRDARFELLVSLGALGVYELNAGTLALGGSDEVTLAAKRVLGIGETMLLERRAGELAAACGLPLAAFDLALHNWGSGTRVTGGFAPEAPLDQDALARVRAALALEPKAD